MLVAPVPQVAAAPGESDAASLSEAQQALADAQESGEQVEVVGERTDRTTVYANPDGFTFTLEESVVPVRVAKPGGGWQAPDATLETRSDGSVGPKAAALSIGLSGGGDSAPLARIEDQGKALELEWSGKLPAPQLDGASAVYSDVLPGVDLQVTVTPESFQPVFVVKTPEAAANDELKKLTFGLQSRGLDIREGAAGNLTAVDGRGQTVFKAPPARMWDSAGDAAATSEESGTQTQLMRAQAYAAEATTSSDSAEAAPSGTGLEPGQGDKVVKMDVAVTEGSLSVVPDSGMLAKTDASAFPVFIDPKVSWGESERTLLRSDGYESYGWGNGDDDQGKGAGKCGTWNGYYCGPGYVQKLYFEFSPASLKGKKVLDVTFRVTEPWAFQCDPRMVDLVRTNNISSATTWASRPAELDLMGDQNVSAGRGSLCDPDSPDAPIEFRDNPSETNENLTSTVSNFAAGKFSRLTLEIKAHDESDPAAWKRFKNDATLEVKFVAVPAVPTEVGLVTGTGYVCSTNSTDPAVVSDPTPQVQGRPRTASGGESYAHLRIRWRVDKYDGTNWVLATTDVDSPTSGYAGNLVKQSRSLATLQEGVSYRVKALTLSYDEKGENRLNTGYTKPCYFKVDPTAPKAPLIAVASPYTQCTINECTAHGGPGVKGMFTFNPAAGDEKTNVSYQYRLSSTAEWSPEQLGTSVSAGVTPPKEGTYRLYVRAKDTAGRHGAQSVFDFLVADGEKPVGRWNFTEADGVAVDSETWDGSDNATLAGGASRDDRGRRGLITRDAEGVVLETPVTDKGMALDGSTGYAATAAPVLDTSASYTVSAWVRVDTRASRTLTALSQVPDSPSPFTKKYIPFGLSYAGGGANTWSLSVMGTDGSLRKVSAQQATPRGVWTHVAGVYDAGAKKISLYVNGELQSAVDSVTAWKGSGPLQIGRGIWADAFTDYFDGNIDEPAAWQRVLTPQEIADEAQTMTSKGYAGVELVADWSADRGSGTTIADTTSGYGRSLTLSGGASLKEESIVLDGVDGAATTAGPIVDDTGSFTITALASVDADTLKDKSVGFTGQVAGQRTADGSAWGFWYELTGKSTVWDEDAGEEKTVPLGLWHFGRLNTDGTFSAVASEEAVDVAGTVRMTGAFNAQDGTLSLYLGGVQNGDDKAFTAKIGSGDFAVGKGFSNGGWEHYLPGRVAEVRLWAGAMAGSDQVEETVGD
ncbi:LamG domain-containing protein [Streptomyces sp. NPDC001381]|uniref:LamG domain-containing protein n=1 Tax=Streptomyces sp. NPDC001381 TaxID=3364567 RepID=UPI0036B591F3